VWAIGRSIGLGQREAVIIIGLSGLRRWIAIVRLAPRLKSLSE